MGDLNKEALGTRLASWPPCRGAKVRASSDSKDNAVFLLHCYSRGQGLQNLSAVFEI